MASRERPVDRGDGLGRAALVRLGGEIRHARMDRGLSLDEVAAAVGLSSVELGRIERGLAPKVPLINLARIAGAVGLDLVPRLYPGASVVRDAAHGKLLFDLRQLLHESLRWDMEVPFQSLVISGHGMG